MAVIHAWRNGTAGAGSKAAAAGAAFSLTDSWADLADDAGSATIEIQQ